MHKNPHRCEFLSTARTVCVASILFTIAFILLCAGCSSRTEVTGRAYYPPNSTRETYEYSAFVVSKGAYGKQYSDSSQKEVEVSVKAKTGILFTKRYYFDAGNLDWEIIWPEAEDLRIRFFERKTDQSERLIKTIKLIIDPKTLRYVEVNGEEGAKP